MRTLKDLQDYRLHTAVSQSELKQRYEHKDFRGESLTMLFGSYIDCILTTPHLIDEIYTIVDAKRPSDKITAMCRSLSLMVGEMSKDLEDHTELIKVWIETQDYYQNLEVDNRVKNFIKSAKEWWEQIALLGDKVAISSGEKAKYESMASLVRMETDISGECQYPFYFNSHGYDCKGLGDIVQDKVYKDIKYTECRNIREWTRQAAAKLMYPFQMSFYREGLGYSKSYKWLVVGENWVQEIECSTELMDLYRDGFEMKKDIGGERVVHKFPGWVELLTNPNWDNFDFNLEYFKYL